MEVKIQQTSVIHPIKPPFDHDHVLSLSHIDTDRNLHVTLRYLRLYAPNHQQQTDPFHVITTALSAALFHYYPFAGTLLRRHSDDRLELHCHVDDGVPVISASVNCDLTQLVNFSEIDEKLMDQFIPESDLKSDPNPIRPIILQVTRFECGGFVLGAAVHHAISDGLGATLFFNSMAEFARGTDRITVEPIWDRTTLLGPRNPARLEYPIQEYLSLDKDFYPYLDSAKDKRVVKKYINVNELWLDRFKGFLLEKSGFKFTTFEALGAFIWRARTKAYGVSGDEKVTFAYSINIRKLLNPPLPDSYWGNGCVPMYVHLPANVLLDQPIWKTIELIKKSKYDVTNEYVRSFIDFQELYYLQGITPGRSVSGFTDWRHLGHSTVDFGWGGPVSVVPLSRCLLGSIEPCFFLPGKDGNIEVLVHLEEGVMEAFTQEMDKLRNYENEFQVANL